MSRPGGWCPGCRSRSASASSLYFTADREPSLWAASRWQRVACAVPLSCARAAGRAFRSLLALAAAAAGFATATLQERAHRASGAAAPAWNVAIAGFVEVREERERTDRIVVRVHRIDGAAARARRRSACASRCARARRRRSAAFVDVQGAADAAARAAAARRLRLRARPVFPGHRRVRLRARRDQDCASRRSPPASWLRYADRHRRHARRHRRAHPRRACRATRARSPRR